MRVLFILMVFAYAAAVMPAQTHTTVRHHQEQVVDEDAAELNQAQEAIQKNDFTTARTLLQKYTAKDPKDYRGWYTLAYADSASGDKSAAVEDYKRALSLKPDLFEANLNLGLLLAQSGDRKAALPYVQKATAGAPNADIPALRNQALANAWDALGNLQSGEEAKRSYERALALDPQDERAKEGMKRENSLPVKIQGVTQVALTTSHLEELHTKDPNNLVVAGQLAQNYTDAKEYAKAEPLLKQLAGAEPSDAKVNYNYGVVLMNLQRPQDAQTYYIKALQLDPKLTGAYGNLAIVAAENKNYGLSMKALDARAQYLPENTGSLFLRATNLDHLQQIKAAAIMYRKFLAIAHGESPDNEWQAKHRLVALDPKNETKGKEN